jgi:aryl-alcohol dehydrogenase-like predicted oxidoreductase
MRFTLSLPGVHTAIVGTKNPDRWLQNAQLLAEGPLTPDEMASIRSRWTEAARKDWEGMG